MISYKKAIIGEVGQNVIRYRGLCYYRGFLYRGSTMFAPKMQLQL